MYKVISFDIGGTLINTLSNDIYTLDKLVSLLGMEKKIVRPVFKKIFQTKKGTLEELINLFCKELNIEKTDDVVSFFTEKYKKENNVGVLNEEAISVIGKLKDKGYRIILFSNSCCLIDNNLGDDILKYIDRVFYSYDLGYTKSDMEAYRIIENEIGYSGNEILHIGDDLSSDYIKPRENGWNVIYYGDASDSEVTSINSLSDILKEI